MTLSFTQAFVTSLFLVSIRIGALFLFTPLFATGGVPPRVRMLFTIALAALLVFIVPFDSSAAPATMGHLLVAGAFEVALGGVLAFGVSAAFAAFQLGGRVLDFQLGFGVANLIDPATRTQAPLLGTMLGMMGVTIFFAVDAHHHLIRGLAHSLQAIPPGTGPGDVTIAALADHFGRMFRFALSIVAAPVLALLLADLGIAFAGRTMPQFNMFILGIPIKVVLGIALLAGSLAFVSPLLARLFESIFLFWDEVLG